MMSIILRGTVLVCAAVALMMGSATLLLANADDSKKQAEPDFSPSPGATVPGISYRIGAGDILQINVLKEPDASVAAVSVRSDGVISLPYLKDVHAAGLTPRELEATLTGKLARFIREPDVTVVVKEIHSEMVYLIGAVRKEGAVRLSGPLTVLQAVANAGGLTDYAKRSKIYILRMEHSKQVRIPFDYSAVVKGDRLQDNILLRPGDTIVVPQ